MMADSSAAMEAEVGDSAWDELEARVKAHHYTKNMFRTNLGGATMRYGPKRKVFLADGKECWCWLRAGADHVLVGAAPVTHKWSSGGRVYWINPL